MRFLFICTNSPFDDSGGGEQRSKLLFEALCRLGFVDLVCFTTNKPPEAIKINNFQIRFFGDIWKNQIRRGVFLKNKARFWSPNAIFDIHPDCKKIVEGVLRNNNYDYIVVRYLETVFLCGLFPGNKVIVDFDDDPGQKYYSYFRDRNVRFKIRFLCLYQLILYRLHRKTILAGLSHALCSNKDFLSGKKMSYLPNMPLHHPDYSSYEGSLPDNNILLFVGKMAYEPNWRGVDRFIKHVWPQVINSVPDAMFQVAGKGAPIVLKEKWSLIPGVYVLGFVDNITQVYEACKLVVAPIYHGAGTNIKVLEAMAMNRTCVASEFATRGLTDFLSHRENIMIAKNNFEFAETIIELLKDKELNNKIRKNAMQTIEELFNKDMFCQVIKDVFNSLQS